MHTRKLSNCIEWTCWCTGQKGCQNYTNTYYRNILPFYYTFKTGVSKCIQTWTRDKVIPKPWKQEITKIPDWPRRKAVAEFRLCVGHDCLGTYHRIGIRADPHCMLCSLHEPMGRNHLGQCTALFTMTECERYWDARTKTMENWLGFFFYYYVCDFLLLGHFYLPWMLYIVFIV